MKKSNLKNPKFNYRVSLAIKVYANFETKQIAFNEKEAIEKAIKKYENGEYDIENISEPDWANSELDIGENYSGAFVEIVKKVEI